MMMCQHQPSFAITILPSLGTSVCLRSLITPCLSELRRLIARGKQCTVVHVFLFHKCSLPQTVATVDDAVVAGHEGRAFAGKVNGEVVEVIDVAQTLLRGVVNPDPLLRLKSWNAVEGGVHVAGADGVDADTVASPLSGQRLRELHDGGLAGVVTGLLLWVVDDRTGHGGDVDDAAALAASDHLVADSLRHQEGTSDIDIDQAAELVVWVGLGFDVGTVAQKISHAFSWYLRAERALTQQYRQR